MLLDIEKGGYYGHPNPARSEFVLHGANPTAGVDPQEVPDYPVGTRPNPRWHPPAFVFGKNVSPDGMIEYHAPPWPCRRPLRRRARRRDPHHPLERRR